MHLDLRPNHDDHEGTTRTKTMLQFRQLDLSELESAGRLFASAYPPRAHETRLWQHGAGSPERAQRWVGGFATAPSLVTYAAIWNVERQKYRFVLIVDDAWRRRGIGSQSLAMVLTEAHRAGARTLQARADAECTDAIAFLTRREFVETMRMQGFLLDLSRIDDRRLSTQRQRLTSTNTAIVPATISDISDREFWRKIAGVQSVAQGGWPDPDPDGIVDVMSETELRRMLVPSGELPLAFFVAERHGEFLGIATARHSLWPRRSAVRPAAASGPRRLGLELRGRR